MGEHDYTIEDIIDQGALGPEPSEAYLESLNAIDNVVRDCMHIGREHAGIPSPTTRHFYASVLFTQMITKCVSLLMLAPHTPWASKCIEHWDYGSMTGIARTMIELRAAYHYLCVEPCPDEEWKLRWNLFNLHDCTSRIRMFDALGNAEEVAALEPQAEELRDRLRTNAAFQALDTNRHKKLLHGQTAYLFPLEVLSERAGTDLRTFRSLYVILSSHVHALPMSFYRIGGDNPERGRGLPSPIEENYSSLCLSLAATLLARSRDEFLALFDGHTPPATEGSADTEPPELPDLAIGEEKVIELSEELAVRMKLTAEHRLEMTYVHRHSQQPVLDLVEHETGEPELVWADPVFWTFLVNGGPASELSLEAAMSRPHAYRVDHNRREIQIKTQDEDEASYRGAEKAVHDRVP